MSKPDDIPQDVWNAAAVGVDYYSKRQVHIARAIMAERERIEGLLKDPAAVRVNYLRGGIACQNLIDEAVAAERERCAKVADKFAEKYRDGNFRGDWAMAAHQIAAAIRKGGD